MSDNTIDRCPQCREALEYDDGGADWYCSECDRHWDIDDLDEAGTLGGIAE